MQDPTFISYFKATWNSKVYPIVTLVDYENQQVTFQDLPYHPSEIHTRPLSEVLLEPNT